MNTATRNYYAFLWHATFFALTATFTEINTVLPSLVVKVGGGTVQIGFLTAIMVGTPIVGQLFFASYLHLQPRKRFFLLLGVGLRIAALASVALVLLAAESFVPTTLISLVFLLMFIFSLSGTFSGVSYTDILGKSLAVEQRSRFFVNRQIFTSVAFLISAPLSRWVLGYFVYPLNYVWMFGLAAGLLFIAFWGFWAIDEPEVQPSREAHSFLQVLRAIPRHLRASPSLRKYIFLVNMSGFGLTLMPFYVAYASKHYGLTGEQIGNYLMVQIVGMILSNLVWGKAIKKFGFRGVVRGCIGCGTVLPLLVLILSGKPLPLFLTVFFLMGVAISARKIAFEGLLIEITTNTNRALYKGIVGATSLTTALFPLVAGALILWVGYPPVFLFVAILVASAWFTVTGIVPEPQV
ncbi:Major Facilitator Superfamily protein [Desulfuromusa kysingii]|uniref:Major Facilitator Superfamily protein n=1 Tax=Desulfuromusa kysingii TaxID=37625 RepID=A0A1H3XJJ8_9BACT|nr:MFS transporter [Desulfuromusa kysingii]SDZ98782.1 Major Facilitator Superfamily protein [Desulfuromusa kysingii]